MLQWISYKIIYKIKDVFTRIELPNIYLSETEEFETK